MQNVLAGFGVEISRRFIAQDGRRVGDDGAGDRHPLHLPPGHFLREVPGTVGHEDSLDGGLRLLHRRVAADAAKQQRQGDVFQCRERGDQVEELKDKADFGSADQRSLAIAEFLELQVLKKHLTGGGGVERAEQVQQRGLA